MRLVLLGPPGAGKGTQAALLARRYGVPAISTGELFRAAASGDTETGRSLRAHMASGRLIPDDVTNTLVARRLAEADTLLGFVLDGFPRTLDQAAELDRMMRSDGSAIDAVLALRVNPGDVVRRLAGRRTCRECGAASHVEFCPTSHPERCDNCGGALYQRDDDTPSAVEARLAEYAAHTRPLLAYYADHSRLIEIDAIGVVEDVTAAAYAALDDIRRRMLSARPAAAELDAAH